MASIAEVQELTSPNPICLITSRISDEKTNIMALSWWTYLSNSPAYIGISLSQKSLTNQLIHHAGEFGLNIVGPDLVEAAFKCGTVSGRDVDKAAAFQIVLIDAEYIATKIVKSYRVALECNVKNFIEVDEHTFFVSEVVAIHTHPNVPQLFAFDGYQRLNTLSP